jgi:hypothetical protein
MVDGRERFGALQDPGFNALETGWQLINHASLLTRPSAMTVVDVMFGGGLSEEPPLSAVMIGALC